MYKNYINDLVNDSFKLIIQDIEENSETEIEMEEKINRIIENMEDISKESVELIIDNMVKDITTKMDEKYNLIEQDEQDFIEHVKYEWARNSGLFRTNENITFNKIFIKCNFENEYSTIWKTQYKKQCKLLHTTPQGVTKSLCLPPNSENEIVLVGQSPYGLNIAAEHSAIYLINTINNYLMVVDNQWNLLITRVLSKILNMIQCEYTKIAQKMGSVD